MFELSLAGLIFVCQSRFAQAKFMGTFFHILVQCKVRSFIILANGFYGFLVIAEQVWRTGHVMCFLSIVCYEKSSHQFNNKAFIMNSLPSSFRSSKYFSLNVN